MKGAALRVSEQERFKGILVEMNDRTARVWDHKFVPAIAAIRNRLIELARVEPGERILDVGTGTGAVALAVAQRVGGAGRVVGIDTSPKMLVKAQENAARARTNNVEFRMMDSSSLEWPDESFDAVISCLGQPEAPWDVRPALIEWRRVLTASGRLCLCTEAQDPYPAKFQDVCAKYRVRNPSRSLSARRKLLSRVSEEATRIDSFDPEDPSKGVRLLESADFIGVRHFTEPFEVTIGARAQLELLLTWGIDYAEYAEMTRSVRDRFRREALETLRPSETLKGEMNFFSANRAPS